MSTDRASSVLGWDYESLRDCLTDERLSSYLHAVRGDLVSAFELYEWNISASASILALTSMVEVVVRNALDRELIAWAEKKTTDQEWFDVAPLDGRGRADVSKARERATRRGKRPEIHGKVVAELTLGFWRFLVEFATSPHCGSRQPMPHSPVALATFGSAREK